VLEADVIVLNWINQGVLSLRELERILALGKPVVWTLHDLWTAMGICHLPGDCDHFRQGCGSCPLLHSTRANDLSAKVWRRKKAIYERHHFTTVAVSHRERETALSSPLMAGHPITVIPNGFPIPDEPIGECPSHDSGKVTIVMGAARLDDPVKGIEVMIRATQLLRQRHPDIADKFNLLTFGNIRDASLLDDIPPSWSAEWRRGCQRPLSPRRHPALHLPLRDLWRHPRGGYGAGMHPRSLQ
jgi:glycosyltransferase involved in cell wall biosynthesis